MSTKPSFDPVFIAEMKQKMISEGTNFLYVEDDDSDLSDEEGARIYFIGNFEGKEVVYDAMILTLRVYYQTEISAAAEAKTDIVFPEFAKKRQLDPFYSPDPENSPQEYEMLEYIMTSIAELEDAEFAVSEIVTIDEDTDFGLELLIVRNVEEIDDEFISEVVDQYNSGNLVLDSTLYSFPNDNDDEDED